MTQPIFQQFPIEGFPEVHLDGIFFPFEYTVNKKLEELRLISPRSSKSDKMIKFLEYLLENIDCKEFRRIQERNIPLARSGNGASWIKYLNPITWSESKLNLSLRYGLDVKSGLNILDIGTGPGHFQVVAQFLGHKIVGTETPEIINSRKFPASLYHDLDHIYSLTRVPLRIAPFLPISGVGKGYDLITAFMSAFNVDQQGNPWKVDMWEFFLKDIKRNILAKDGSFLITLTHGKVTDDVMEFLFDNATSVTRRNLEAFFDNLNWIDADSQCDVQPSSPAILGR